MDSPFVETAPPRDGALWVVIAVLIAIIVIYTLGKWLYCRLQHEKVEDETPIDPDYSWMRNS